MNLENINKRYLLILILIIVLGANYYYNNSDKNNNRGEELQNIGLINNEDMVSSKEIIIHISGEIKNPGVYKMPENSRLVDLIKIAGGTLITADLDSVNLASNINDGEKIIIPSLRNKAVLQESSEKESLEIHTTSSLININTASTNQLEELPGIGPSRAASIVEYRKINGNFNRIEDLKNIRGIGDKIFEELKDRIRI